MSLPKVILQKGKAKPFFSRHPWVFAGAVDRIEGDAKPGDEVELLSTVGNFVARGFLNPNSKIRVRLYSWNENQLLDESFFGNRLEKAIQLRESLGLMAPEGGCRLIFSEGDGLSGLSVDRYGDYLVMQVSALGIFQRREMIAGILQKRLSPKGIFLRTDKTMAKLEGFEALDEWIFGDSPSDNICIQEYGLQFQIHLASGQKTGYYLDQRDNRVQVAKLSRGKRLLDVFCYAGGFSLHAMNHGALATVGIDQSQQALELAASNASLNHFSNCQWIQGEAFDEMDKLVESGEKFGVVVLDPPRFARNRNDVKDALRGYRRLHMQGLKLVEDGGFLVSCCCSGAINMDMMEELLAQVATDQKRDIQVIEKRGPSGDHPVSVSCLESHYLKCLITRVL